MTPPEKALTRSDPLAGLVGGLSAYILFVVPAVSHGSVLRASLVVFGCGLAAGFIAEMLVVGARLPAA